MDRVTATGPRAPLGGIERSGYRLTYNDTDNQYLKDRADALGVIDAVSSIGARIVDESGMLQDVVPGTPAYEAGLAPGMKLIAVNGRRYTSDVFRDALLATSKAPSTLTLLVETNDFFTEHSFPYGKGLQQPHLERDGSKPDLLERQIAPLTSAPAGAP
jgi:predicted metalloprotease with PDZ domain